MDGINTQDVPGPYVFTKKVMQNLHTRLTEREEEDIQKGGEIDVILLMDKNGGEIEENGIHQESLGMKNDVREILGVEQ